MAKETTAPKTEKDIEVVIKASDIGNEHATVIVNGVPFVGYLEEVNISDKSLFVTINATKLTII